MVIEALVEHVLSSAHQQMLCTSCCSARCLRCAMSQMRKHLHSPSSCCFCKEIFCFHEESSESAGGSFSERFFSSHSLVALSKMSPQSTSWENEQSKHCPCVCRRPWIVVVAQDGMGFSFSHDMILLPMACTICTQRFDCKALSTTTALS